MVCPKTCLFSSALLGASLFTIIGSNEVKRKANDLLDEEQREVYKSIISERTSIYFKGLVLGVFFAILWIISVNDDKTIRKGCGASLITLLVSIVYYLASTKSKYMRDYLNDDRQMVEWNNIGNTMKTRYFIGAVLGLSACYLFAMSF
jgi:hypothetical protein